MSKQLREAPFEQQAPPPPQGQDVAAREEVATLKMELESVRAAYDAKEREVAALERKGHEQGVQMTSIQQRAAELEALATHGGGDMGAHRKPLRQGSRPRPPDVPPPGVSSLASGGASNGVPSGPTAGEIKAQEELAKLKKKHRELSNLSDEAYLLMSGQLRCGAYGQHASTSTRNPNQRTN